MSVILDVQKEIQTFQYVSRAIIEGMMIQQGGLNPTLLMLCEKDGQLVPCMAPSIGESYNKENKDLFRKVVTGIIKELKPVAIAIASEAWMIVKPTKEDVDFNIPVAEQEGRKEVVCLQFETYNKAELIVLDIIRNGEKITLAIDENLSGPVNKDQTEGTFCNLLNENYERFHKELKETINKSLN